MQILASTRGKHAAVPMKDKTGRDYFVCILKYTYSLDAGGTARCLEEDAPAPLLIDEYNGEDPSRSSIRRPSQLFDWKPGTDVILIGHAYPPARGSASSVDVSLRMGPIDKTVRVHGLRVWQRGSLGVVPGPARPLREPIPLVYELAWGGQDLSDPARPVVEARNHVGRGVARDPRTLVDRPAAQIESPAYPIGAGDNAPACFGAIHRHWQPRLSYAGTYDQAWMDTKMPLLPDDFDPRFHVVVPHDQWSPTPLRGDEVIEVRGATPEGIWRFQLPRIAPGFASRVDGVRAEHRTHVDTVLIDADLRRVELTWRCRIPLPRKFERLREVRITEKALI